jgi:hypothetical protein
LNFVPNTSRLSLEATTFLSRKGFHENSKEFIVMRQFGGDEKPLLLPFYVSNKRFAKEMCRRYKNWTHFLNERRKNKFIPLPRKIGEFIIKNITHLDELTCHFDQLGLKEAKFIKGFDLDNKFTAHMELF